MRSQCRDWRQIRKAGLGLEGWMVDGSTPPKWQRWLGVG